MYLIKNAWRNIQRSLGKNILIGIIVVVIALSSCLALSIKQAANKTKEQGLKNINITANISYDRKGMMENAQPPNGNEDIGSSKAQMQEMFTSQSLSLEELKKYAKAKSVQDFYYTLQTSLNGTENLTPIENAEEENLTQRNRVDISMNSSDFSMRAYSSYEAMDDFQEGTKKVSEGKLFSLEKEECIISEELALYNSLSIGDQISLTNPNNEEESFTLTISGIYTNTDTSSNNNFIGNDPANEIYTSTTTLNTMLTHSQENSESTAINAQLNGTYVFENVDNYEKFEEQARKLGLDDTYTISSSDISSYEESLSPLLSLANYATIFLWIILIIGGVILLIFNIFRLKERKYEIGVLAAIGMNKIKIATQFMIEMFIITFVSILLGTAIGSVASVPVTNTLLSNSSVTSESQSKMPQDMPSEEGTQRLTPPSSNENRGSFRLQNIEYINEITSATDFSVVLQLLGIGLLLTIISGGISIIVILRYEPLKILSNRD